ncbi:hypothetical protein L1887_21833 [Cichorium endivia]|nr:hypothetical protein L1887_21833 [Cichorium endivia]
MLVPRSARENSNVAGYDHTEGTRVLVSIWSIGRDPNLQDKLEEFFLEMFIVKEIDVKGSRTKDVSWLAAITGLRLVTNRVISRKCLGSIAVGEALTGPLIIVTSISTGVPLWSGKTKSGSR